MMHPAQIRSMQQEAAEEAARDKVVPFVYWKHDDLGPPFPFPNLGDYVPPCWEMVDHFMVDASGFGAPDEPADTPTQLRARMEREIAKYDAEGKTVGWAIIEVGQFQVVIGEFTKVDC
jgi:hypothetical protein